MFLLLLCSVYSNNLCAQALTDWEVNALKGKVKQTVEIKISGDGQEKRKVVSSYNEDGFIENVKIYALNLKDDEEVYWGQIVYEKYVGSKRKAISFDQNEIKLKSISYSWATNNTTKLCTVIFGDLVTEGKPMTMISVFNANNQKENEKLLESGEERFNEPPITTNILFEYDENGNNIAYEQTRRIEQEGYLDEKKSYKVDNETFDDKGNVTKQQVMLNGKLFSAIVYIYSYY